MLAQPALPCPKLVEPTSKPVEWPRTGQPHPRVEPFYRAPELVSTQPFADAHVLAQPALPCPKLVEPTSKPVEWPRTGQPHPRVEPFYRAPEMVSTQPFADAHVLAQPALSCPKLVEPTSERQRAGRVETTVRTSENSRSGLLFGCRMVSTRAAPSSQPGSTNFRERTPFLVHESRKKNGSMSCGDVEPSNLRDSCTKGEGRAKRRRKR